MVNSAMIDIDLTEDGSLQSCLVRDCAGRKIDLAGLNEGPHPLQLIPSRWKALAKSLELFVDELGSVEASIEPNGDLITALFRQLIYDATELFESYALLVPKRVITNTKAEKAAFADFKLTSKRLREPCAHLCNRCKHQGAQIRFLWAKSSTNWHTGSRILIATYSGGDGLLRDDTIHRGVMAGIGLVRWAHELAHNLLRIDHAAAVLINHLSDGNFLRCRRYHP